MRRATYHLFAACVAVIGSSVAGTALAQDGGQWNAFAMQVAPVEGKHRDKKHRDDVPPHIEPQPAPAPEPEQGDNVEPVDKKVKPLPRPAPETHDSDKPGRNRDSHNTTIIDRTVYRTSLLPSVYDLVAWVWLFILTVYVCRRLGLGLGSLFAWRK